MALGSRAEAQRLWLWALEQRLSGCGSWALEQRLSGCGSWALEQRLSGCGTQAQLLHNMWDLSRSGFELVSPAITGRFFTTEKPWQVDSI